MLITFSTTRRPATDLGYLMAKHPDKFQSFKASGGRADIFWPEATEEKATIALALHLNPVTPARPGQDPLHRLPESYVNDKAYAAGSRLAVAMNHVFRSAMAGDCKAKPELVNTPIPLEIKIPAIHARRGNTSPHSLFEPLGYRVETAFLSSGNEPPEQEWRSHMSLTLSQTATVQECLRHIYVLLPVMDGSRHEDINQSEAEKLLRAGEGWLNSHPLKETITRVYLRNRAGLVSAALARLPENPDEDEPDPAAEPGPQETRHEMQETRLEKGMGLGKLRAEAVIDAIKQAGARSVADLGCGPGTLAVQLLKDPEIHRVTAADVSNRAIAIARRRAENLPNPVRSKLNLVHTSLTLRDSRLAGHDAAVLMEVIEHLNPDRLEELETAVLGFARPQTLIVTTPNREYNRLFEGLKPGAMRHRDHRFEWTRAEFQDWAERTAQKYGYHAAVTGVGPEDPELGCPSQMATLTRQAPAQT